MSRILTAIMLLVPCWVWAAPTQVTLFPDSAQVEETSAVTPEAGEAGLSACTLILPGQADPASLRFGRLAGTGSIADLSWKMLREENHSAIEPLNRRLEELKAKRSEALSELEGVRGRMAFWKAQSLPAEKTVAALRELAGEMGKALREDSARAQSLETRLEELNAKIAWVEKEIADAAGQGRTVWEVRVLVAGPAPKELPYAYTLRDCGWAPLYRLEASPVRRNVDFSWQAKVWQRSGQDWTNVRLHLATMQPETQAEPSTLPPWEIAPMQIFRKAMAGAPMMAMRSDAANEEISAPAPAEPVQVRHSTYAAWDMGQKSVPAGDTRIFEIEQSAWPASFTHLIRPSLDSKAFIQAKAEFSEPKELPPGTAFFFIDGAMVDQRQFSLSGREATMFFGTDPLVTCATALTDKKTGEKGLFAQKQTFLRQWTMTVRNAADHPVQARIEEPRPLPRDERITIDFTAKPEPLAEDDPEILAWNSTIAPGKELAISLDLKIAAPEDLSIDPGWRW
ncbi:MAG: mucoidy inhibitor MuiA family protein [Desulfomicrobium sp.]|nr:mucoidy inhibitor MuiA family protein [Desulfomicrobium sp.]